MRGHGVFARKLATTKRKDGKLEATFNHHPLYFYAATASAATPTVRASTSSGFVSQGRGADSASP
jgi:hypothetical protein